MRGLKEGHEQLEGTFHVPAPVSMPTAWTQWSIFWPHDFIMPPRYVCHDEASTQIERGPVEPTYLAMADSTPALPLLDWPTVLNDLRSMVGCLRSLRLHCPDEP